MSETEPQSAGLDLDELEGLHWNATPTPWKVLEQPNPSNGTFEVRHPGKNLTEPTERTIATEFDHPQLKSPAQIISQGYTPYFERSPFLHITPEDARYIVAACNAVPQLVGALREAMFERSAFLTRLEQAEAENAALRGERDRYKKALGFYVNDDNRTQSGMYVRANSQSELTYDDGFTAAAALYPEKFSPEYAEQLVNEIFGAALDPQPEDSNGR